MLSMHMHGSHVVERFLLEYEEEKYSSRIIEELISIPELSLNLFQDQWGNYVAQTAKKVAKVCRSIPYIHLFVLFPSNSN